jgi:hypothetical protein
MAEIAEGEGGGVMVPITTSGKLCTIKHDKIENMYYFFRFSY